MIRFATYLFESLHAFEESKLLRKLLALFAIYKCIYWILDYSLLFSDHSMVYKNNIAVPVWQWPAFVLYKSHSAILPMIFLGIVVVMSLYILISKKTFRSAFFILWIAVVNMINNVYCAISAGDVLFQHLLFFCIFLSDGSSGNNAFKNSLDLIIHNTGVIAIRLQICIVYFYAALAKILDQDWLDGNAVNMTLAVYDYSLPFSYDGYGGIGEFLNYLVILYQLLFPVLVWIRPIKKWYLLAGIIQHLFIAFVIGLPSFGLIMIAAYAIFFFPFSKTRKTS